MRKQFSELYLRVCAEPKPEQLEKRWQAIEEYCNQDEVDIYNLVKMAYSLSPTEEFKDGRYFALDVLQGLTRDMHNRKTK